MLKYDTTRVILAASSQGFPLSMTTPRPLASAESYRAPALDKGLDVLELLATQEAGLTLSQIAAALGRSVQEMYRVVVSLERRGYVERGAGDAFRLSLRLFGLACAQPPLGRLLQAAAPVLPPLAARLEQVVTLAVIDGLQFRVVAVGENPAPVGFRVRLGTARPLAVAASGRVLLAFRPEAERLALLAAMGLAAGEAARLARIAARGGEVVAGETLQAITDVSFPVIDATGAAQAALTMPYLAGAAARVPLPEATRQLHAAAEALSHALGGTQPPTILPEELK